ncbi:MAG: amino acid permease [Candidatus Bathyarchaeia archaeon]
MSGSRVVFVREATGLVREISPYQLMIFNFLTAPIVTTLMWSLNWNPNMFPGFDFNTGLLIIALLAVPMYLTYCIVYTAFPKTGTDYVFQSRVLNPGIGFSATFAAWVFFQFWYISLNGISIVEMFLVPWLFAIAQGTNNAGYAAIANALATTNSMAILSFVAVIAAGLIVMGGIRMYLKIQTVLFCFAAAAVIALLVLLASTSNSAFASNLSTNLSGLIGSSDVYNKIIGTAQGEGINLSPTVTLYASIGAMITPWTFALEWTVFGNLGLCGEMKTANQFKTQAITMLGALALVVVGLFAAWNLFIGMTGQNFWYAAATLAWNADPLFGKLPALVYSMPASFFLLYGTNNLALATVWAIGGAITIFATNFTIYMLVSRMLFAQTFDRLFPARLAYITERSRTPIYIMIVMIIAACIWTYASLFYGSTLSTYMASTQFMISLAIILTMIGAIIFPMRMRRHFEQSPARNYRAFTVPLAVLGIAVNILIMYYLVTVPALLATTPQSEGLMVGIFAVGIIYYHVVSAYRKSTGIDIRQAFKEIPPD